MIHSAERSYPCNTHGYPPEKSHFSDAYQQYAEQIEHGLTGKYLPWVVQIKEKFGGLNYYMSFENDEMSDLIIAAAQRSETICENCGKPGKTRNFSGWCVTECEACLEARVNHNKGYTGL